MAVATVQIAEPNRRSKAIVVVLPWAMFALARESNRALNRASYHYFLDNLTLIAGYVTAMLHVLVFCQDR